MHHIRPHHVFDLVSACGIEERIVRTVLPGLIPTPQLLDTGLLVALARLVQPKLYLEIGTYLGVQTLNIAMNLPEDSEVLSIDLDMQTWSAIADSQPPEDREICRKRFARGEAPVYAGTAWEGRITQLLGDSTTYDFSAWERAIDMIYIDGGHDSHTVTTDTENARRLLSSDSLACIVWHDYSNPEYPGLNEYLERISGEIDIYHIEETMLCFHVSSPTNAVASALDAAVAAKERQL